MVQMWMYATAFSLLALPIGAAPWTLRLLPETASEAVCLDGSRPGYYYRPGRGEAASSFKLHLMGGNWCMDGDDCLQRSRGFLGGSTAWPAEPPHGGSNGSWDLGTFGLMSDAGTGKFANWTAVWFMYCDGSSFASHREQPLLVNGTKVHLRGRAILDAILDDLLLTGGLAHAQTVLLSGTSSGGMAVYYHAEHVRSKLRTTTRLLAAPDAGFFPDIDCAPGQCAFRDALKQLVPFWNVSTAAIADGYPGLNAQCVHANAARGETWRCLFAEYALAYVSSVPTFVINSLYDPAAMVSLLNMPCVFNLSSCSSVQMQTVAQWRETMASKLRAISAMPHRGHGVFASACSQHEETCRDADFDAITIRGQTMAAALAAWVDGGARTLVDDSALGANPSCWLPAPTAEDPHGSC